MMGFGASPMSFLHIPKSKRRDRYASAPRSWVVPTNVRPPRQSGTIRYNGVIVRTVRQSQNLRYVGCDLVLLFLGYLMLFGGFTGVGLLGFAPQVAPSQLRPVAAVPAAVMVAGVICIVVATVSAKRKAARLNQNLCVALREAQSARVHSFTATNTRSAPCNSSGRNSRSDNVRGTRSREVNLISTRTTFGNRAINCQTTVYSVQCSDIVPPSYEAVMQSSVHRATYI